MTGFYTRKEVIAAIRPLDEARLVSFIEAEIVIPVQTPDGPVFRQIDIVRMEFLCEMSESFDLEGDALAVLISLVDQLHGTRAELRALVEALAEEPPEVRERVSRLAGQVRTIH